MYGHTLHHQKHIYISHIYMCVFTHVGANSFLWNKCTQTGSQRGSSPDLCSTSGKCKRCARRWEKVMVFRLGSDCQWGAHKKMWLGWFNGHHLLRRKVTRRTENSRTGREAKWGDRRAGLGRADVIWLEGEKCPPSFHKATEAQTCRERK